MGKRLFMTLVAMATCLLANADDVSARRDSILNVISGAEISQRVIDITKCGAKAISGGLQIISGRKINESKYLLFRFGTILQNP